VKPPRRTRVLGQTFTVGLVSNLRVPNGEFENPEINEDAAKLIGVNGVCDSDQQVIWLERHAGHDGQRATFLHEHLHAIFAIAGMRADLLTAETEERVVKCLAPMLLDFLRANPKAIAYMLEKKP